MITKTLDQRLRERARNALRDRLNAALRDAKNAIEILGTTDKVTVMDINKNACVAYNSNLLDQIFEIAFEKLAEKYEEKEVKEFLAKVDGLQDQINGIYDGIRD